jgi:hypothetical protein
MIYKSRYPVCSKSGAIRKWGLLPQHRPAAAVVLSQAGARQALRGAAPCLPASTHAQRRVGGGWPHARARSGKSNAPPRRGAGAVLRAPPPRPGAEQGSYALSGAAGSGRRRAQQSAAATVAARLKERSGVGSIFIGEHTAPNKVHVHALGGEEGGCPDERRPGVKTGISGSGGGAPAGNSQQT